MPWASQRQALYALGLFLVFLLIIGGAAFLFLYETPSCKDAKQNQDETGIDCGGVCTRLCEAPPISALWTRSVKVASGVYHAVAMVQNPDTGAGTMRLPYVFSLYDADNILIAERDGVMSVEPGQTVPLFEANVVTGERVPVRTFIAFGRGEWHRMERRDNPLIIGTIDFNPTTLVLTADVRNASTLPVSGAVFTALIYGEGERVIGASETVISDIPARETVQAVFTWQEPFAEPVVRSVITSRLK